MGKTTLYHPVSLHVIRGAVEYCGWKFKHIKQFNAEPDRGRARYVAEIEIVPDEAKNQSPVIMQNILQDCFMDGIRVHWLRQNKAGTWFIDIQVDLGKSWLEADNGRRGGRERGADNE